MNNGSSTSLGSKEGSDKKKKRRGRKPRNQAKDKGKNKGKPKEESEETSEEGGEAESQSEAKVPPAVKPKPKLPPPVAPKPTKDEILQKTRELPWIAAPEDPAPKDEPQKESKVLKPQRTSMGKLAIEAAMKKQTSQISEPSSPDKDKKQTSQNIEPSSPEKAEPDKIASEGSTSAANSFPSALEAVLKKQTSQVLEPSTPDRIEAEKADGLGNLNSNPTSNPSSNLNSTSSVSASSTNPSKLQQQKLMEELQRSPPAKRSEKTKEMAEKAPTGQPNAENKPPEKTELTTFLGPKTTPKPQETMAKSQENASSFDALTFDALQPSFTPLSPSPKKGIVKQKGKRLPRKPIRIYTEDESYKSFAISTTATADEVLQEIAEKNRVEDWKTYTLAEVDSTTWAERRLDLNEIVLAVILGWEVEKRADMKLYFVPKSTPLMYLSKSQSKDSIKRRKDQEGRMKKRTAYQCFVGLPNETTIEIELQQSYSTQEFIEEIISKAKLKGDQCGLFEFKPQGNPELLSAETTPFEVFVGWAGSKENKFLIKKL